MYEKNMVSDGLYALTVSPQTVDYEFFCNSDGYFRLHGVRRHLGFERSIAGSYVDADGMLQRIMICRQSRRLSASDLDVIKDVYVHWRDASEVLPLVLEYQTENHLFPKYEYVYIPTVKRGNPQYIRLLKKKFSRLCEGPNKVFFEPGSFGAKSTSMLYVTMTIDRDMHTLEDSWNDIGKYYNSAITAIKKKFGKASFLRTWQSHKDGYPHLHVIIYFDAKEFQVFEHEAKSGKHKGRISYRIPYFQVEQFQECWTHGFIDVQAVSDLHTALKDVLKYVTRDLTSGKCDLTNALAWYWGKQQFGMSSDFIDKVCGVESEGLEPSNSDLINPLSDNSNGKLVCIHVLPIISANFLGLDLKNDHPPPSALRGWMEEFMFSGSKVEFARADGVKVIVYSHNYASRMYCQKIVDVYVENNKCMVNGKWIKTKQSRLEVV